MQEDDYAHGVKTGLRLAEQRLALEKKSAEISCDISALENKREKVQQQLRLIIGDIERYWEVPLKEYEEKCQEE